MSNVTAITTNFAEWNALKPVYFPRWAWEKAVQHQPTKYNNFRPVYNGQRVVVT
jgi:hypothetical protein